MRRSRHQIAYEFKTFWKYYVFQSILATFAIFIVILLLQMQHVVVIASIGATAFLVFALPKSDLAQPINILGGYLVRLGCGYLCFLIPQPELFNTIAVPSFIYALAVGLSIFIMVVIDTEHPPAAGVALAVAINGLSLDATGAIIISAVVLSLIHICFKRYLRNLL